METFLGGLAILIIGGLVTAAMKYPEGYQRLYWILATISVGVSIGFIAYQLGMRDGGRIVYPFLDPTKVEKAKAAIVAGYPSEWLLAANSAFLFFVAIISFLPHILGTPRNNGK